MKMQLLTKRWERRVGKKGGKEEGNLTLDVFEFKPRRPLSRLLDVIKFTQTVRGMGWYGTKGERGCGKYSYF